MLGFVVRQLRYRRGRVATLAAGILVAAASFVLLTSAAQTSELQVKGTVAKNFRAAYDILVRPKNSFTQLEKQRGLIRENYLSGIYGGITFHQYRLIRNIPGVEIAAPIANLGYFQIVAREPISLEPFLNRDRVQVYRIRPEWVAQRGLSRYPDADHFLYETRNPLVPMEAPGGLGEKIPGHHNPLNVCGGIQAKEAEGYKPFDPLFRTSLSCFSLSANMKAGSGFVHPRVALFAEIPVAVAAIEPDQEAALLNLNHAMISGRYLRASDRPFIKYNPDTPHSSGIDYRLSPAIVSSRSFTDEYLRVRIDRANLPHTDIAQVLASTAAYHLLRNLPFRSVTTRRYDLRPLYKSALAQPIFSHRWTASSATYLRQRDGRLRVVPVRNDPLSIWKDALYAGGYFPPAPDNRDVQFRRLREYAQSNLIGPRNIGRFPALSVVGRFDPNKLPGFSPLSKVPLETYYPPTLSPADARSKQLLGGKDLLPTQNLGDYAQPPPLLLTSLKGMAPFLNPKNYQGATRRAPISVIRVRVAGTVGIDPLSRERIKAVASAIHRKTGLAVDITAGSSPHPILIDLPKGKFGRPSLTLKEGWVEKGVGVKFLEAVDKKSLFLFSLILVVCGLFLANAALASVRARRTEIGTLLTLGWSRSSIFRAIVAELALVGALAGIAGTVLALTAVPLLSLHISLLRTLLVAPVAVIVAIIAGLLPAWRAARGRPMDALSPPVTGGDRRRHVSHILGMALANTVRIPARTLVAITGLVFGVAALTVLIALNRALQGTLVGTLMGHFISSQIRGVDFLSVLLVIALGGLSVADILFLNLSERSAELVTLRTVGWRDQHLRALIGLEGIATGALGCLIGAALGIGVAALIRGVPLSTIALAAAVAAGAGLVVTVLAALLPLIRITALTPPTVLAEE